ncbi:MULTISPECIES: glycine cleavage system protein GcvH [Nocardioides]|uniref:Glycine cleavage system H protein n=1 Tax=Nocardioides vastitatis TaxID=2568655 RepID=A0ABW0ZEG3_9ACTN|nr:glycine cleavage system protein GcvH [Nocardioides sp.]THI96873.1 glycine cleavage system protein GcvH [Nocardioides sp.]
MTVPSHLQYTAQHEWVALEGDIATVGITEYAAEALGDVVYVDLPDVGASVTAGNTCGEVESTKSVSDLFAPVEGEVVEINQGLVDDSSAVNLAPYEAGWLFRVRVSGIPDLLSADEYSSLISGS